MELSENGHVLLFPFPANGHIKPYLCLAQLLCNAGLRVTFLNTHYNHRRIIHHRHRLAARFPSLHFISISDGLPLDEPRDILSAKFHISILKTAVQAFPELLRSYTNNETSSGRPPITCLITDVVWRFPIDTAEELGVPVLCFCTYSAVYLFLHFWISKLIEDGQLPYPEGKKDQKLHGAGAPPEVEELLRWKDLPEPFAFKGEIKDGQLERLRQTTSTSRSAGLIINTFDDLEAPFVTSLSKIYKKIYTVGPIHSLLKNNSDCAGLGKDEEEGDRSCLGWLDSQASRSVVFVSFGTVVKMASWQLMELWNGLVDSGKPFLLVLRSESIEGDDGKEVVREIMETKAEGRWVIVSWAPQEEVLGHEAVGGFLTHGGWNSTLESIVSGVPMICRPQFGDQPFHRIWLSKAWKIGLGMEEPYDRSTVETMVRSIMEQEQEQEQEGEKMKNRIAELAKQAKDTVGKDGTSFRNLQTLIEHIKKIHLT